MNWFKKLSKNLLKKISDVIWLKKMQKLEIKDGDVLVIWHSGKLSAMDYTNITMAYRMKLSEYGYKVNVLILDNAMEIGVLTKGVKGKHPVRLGNGDFIMEQD